MKRDDLITESARKLSKLGAMKGGIARANVLTPDERKEIARKAVRARWRKEGKLKSDPTESAELIEVSNASKLDDDVSQELPHSLFQGVLIIGNLELPCHVLNNGMRVLTQRGMVSSLGMARGSSAGKGGDRLAKFIGGKLLEPFVSKSLRVVTKKPMIFRIPGGNTAYGYEAMVLVDLCEAVLQAREVGALQKQQEHIAKTCEILMRSFAKVGIIALIDEATGYQEVRAKQALQLKVQAFIADEMQEWARMFPDEFWFELARLEGIHYSPRSRPLRWGRYVMMFVYDAIDAEIGKELRKKNPNPHFLQNHHQWLKKFGRDKVHDQLQRVITIMKLCMNMEDFRIKFSKVFSKSPIQMSFEDIGWDYKPRLTP